MNFRTLALHNILRLYKNVGQYAFTNPQLARSAFENLADLIPGRLAGCDYQKINIGEIEAEWVIPKAAKESPVLLFFHGGGFATGSIKTHRGLVSKIALEAGIKALSIGYHLAPEYQFPSQINECVAAYQYLLDEGYLPQHIAVGGESAGGGLTMGTLLCLRDHDIALPACAILMSPWLDLTASGRTMETNKHKDPMVPYLGLALWASNYAGSESLSTPYASPLFGDMKGLCPIYTQVGEYEILLDDARRLDSKAQLAGVDSTLEVWDHMFHAWQGFWMLLPEGREAIEKLGAYLKSKLDPLT